MELLLKIVIIGLLVVIILLSHVALSVYRIAKILKLAEKDKKKQ